MIKYLRCESTAWTKLVLALKNKLQWNLNQIIKFSISKGQFKILANLSKPQCINSLFGQKKSDCNEKQTITFETQYLCSGWVIANDNDDFHSINSILNSGPYIRDQNLVIIVAAGVPAPSDAMSLADTLLTTYLPFVKIFYHK